VCARFFELCAPAMAAVRKHRDYAMLWSSSHSLPGLSEARSFRVSASAA
jgi:hypothetical protein